MRIVLLNTHPLVRLGLRRVLEAVLPHAAIDEYDNADRALIADFDLLILDGDSAGKPAHETLSLFNPSIGGPAFVVLMTGPSRAAAIACIQAGAMAIIEKGARPEVLGKALELVMVGGVYVAPEVALAANEEVGFDLNGRNGLLPASPPALSPRQKEVVQLAAGGASNKEIARALHLAPATVKVHLAAALRAFHVRNRAELASAAARFGMVH